MVSLFECLPLGVTELQNFVQVALNNATTGEDTLTNAKLSSLRTVGSGFGCLIYELPKDASFAVLKQQCMLLWENMITTPELPQYLVSVYICWSMKIVDMIRYAYFLCL